MPMLFFDWETRSALDLTVTGTLKYVLDPSTQPLLLSWAVDDEPVKLWCQDLRAELVPEVWTYVEGRMTDVGVYPGRIGILLQQPDGYVIAHNAAFDRNVWQQIATPDYGFPYLPLERVLDNQAQAQASNLPGSLDFAGRALGLGTKTIGGKAIMKRFADAAQPLPGAPADIAALMAKGYSREKAVQTAIDAWALYLDYSVQDTELMRDVWKCTRPLDSIEWAEYHTSERINDRGMLADLDVCRGAVAYRGEEAEYVEERIKEITGGAVTKPTLTKQINEWLYDRLPDDMAETMVKARDDEGYVTRLTGAKDVMTRLLEDIQTSDAPPSDEVIEFLELLQYGRSSSAVKFEKILNQEVDGRLGGSYVFNGAGQTGRYSSRGVQVHNFPRDYFKNELDILDMVAAGVPIERLREIGPVSSVLAKLIRPTFIAPPGKLLVWGDWSAIEARVNPWLADSREAEAAVLTPFRESDADDSVPDVYVLNAATVFKIDPHVLWERYKNGDPEAKAMRQAGKVMVLSLGFLGSVGALKAMARGYGIRLSNEEGKTWVDGWRDRNRWARRFGDKCELAGFTAIRQPGSVQKAGRVRYQYVPNLMRGTLVCFLPDGRPIVYPMAKIQKVEKFGKDTDAITYLNGMGRRSLWNGLMVENCLAGDTQVLTSTGRKGIDSVSVTDLLWDGEQWVSHAGLVFKGAQPVIAVSGVMMTPDHLILTKDGWREAALCDGLDRQEVRLPDSDWARLGGDWARLGRDLASAVRMRKYNRMPWQWLERKKEADTKVLRVQNVRIVQQYTSSSRNEPTSEWDEASPRMALLAVDETPLHQSKDKTMASLRRARDNCLRTLAERFRRVLGGHGAVASSRSDARANRQQRKLRTGELPMGDAPGAVAQYGSESDDRYAERPDADLRSSRLSRHQQRDDEISSTPWISAGVHLGPSRYVGSMEPVAVYDLIDCGPRNRFTVFDSDGVPFLVHNCTQATAASILRQTLVRLDVEEKEAQIVLHTHDEVGGEVDETSAGAFAERLHETMTRGWDWTEGLPLAAEVSTSWYYTKSA